MPGNVTIEQGLRKGWRNTVSWTSSDRDWRTALTRLDQNIDRAKRGEISVGDFRRQLRRDIQVFRRTHETLDQSGGLTVGDMHRHMPRMIDEEEARLEKLADQLQAEQRVRSTALAALRAAERFDEGEAPPAPPVLPFVEMPAGRVFTVGPHPAKIDPETGAVLEWRKWSDDDFAVVERNAAHQISSGQRIPIVLHHSNEGVLGDVLAIEHRPGELHWRYTLREDYAEAAKAGQIRGFSVEIAKNGAAYGFRGTQGFTLRRVALLMETDPRDKVGGAGDAASINFREQYSEGVSPLGVWSDSDDELACVYYADDTRHGGDVKDDVEAYSDGGKHLRRLRDLAQKLGILDSVATELAQLGAVAGQHARGEISQGDFKHKAQDLTRRISSQGGLEQLSRLDSGKAREWQQAIEQERNRLNAFDDSKVPSREGAPPQDGQEEGTVTMPDTKPPPAPAPGEAGGAPTISKEGFLAALESAGVAPELIEFARALLDGGGASASEGEGKDKPEDKKDAPEGAAAGEDAGGENKKPEDEERKRELDLMSEPIRRANKGTRAANMAAFRARLARRAGPQAVKVVDEALSVGAALADIGDLDLYDDEGVNRVEGQLDELLRKVPVGVFAEPGSLEREDYHEIDDPDRTGDPLDSYGESDLADHFRDEGYSEAGAKRRAAEVVASRKTKKRGGS